uniref:Uncharacterized protein n=1 Tax=Candidatus Kentrum sp. LFY TaxID=2126342 RepID=A0A450UYG3_9GAMM|nr:MAG: hypothetical protein BECKLFY1418B_GA0070995_11043 [Candidatus Kentron sp. LFY]
MYCLARPLAATKICKKPLRPRPNIRAVMPIVEEELHKRRMNTGLIELPKIQRFPDVVLSAALK